MKKKILAILLCVIICLNTALPAFAVLPENLTERTNEYSVTIKSGNGSIKVNKDETVYSKDDWYDSIKYISAGYDDFENVDEIELLVREGETIKDRLNYTSTREDYPDNNFYDWENEAFITSTPVVKSILQHGLSTYIHNNSNKYDLDESLAAALSGMVYPKNCTKAYLFIPNSDELIFSHFINQDGETVNLSEPVTKDLILTPIYTTSAEANADKFFNKDVYSVTIVPGEGRLQRYLGDKDYVPRPNDEYYNDVDKIQLTVEAGDTKLIDITTPYARLKYGDLEKADFVLQNGKSEVLSYINSGDGKQAVQSFNELIEFANSELWFTDGGIMNYLYGDNVQFEGKEMLRENGYSLFFLLLMWCELLGDYYVTPETIKSILDDSKIYDSLSQDKKDELLRKTKDTTEILSNAWDGFLLRETENCSKYYSFVTDKNTKGTISVQEVYTPSDTIAKEGDIFRLKPPYPDETNYVFDHFVDQDGNIFNLGDDPVNRDLVLTPIYYDSWDSTLTSNIGNVFVTTEDNSNENFSVSVNRASDGIWCSYSGENIIYDSFNNYVNSLFTEEEKASLVNNPKRLVELFNARSYFKINEGHIFFETDHDGNKLKIQGLLLPLEYLNNKSSYTFDESLWTIDENGQITDYSGDIGLIGVPESINGITVTSISATAFANLSDRYILDPNNSGDKEGDYFQYCCAIWLPKTIENLETGLIDDLLEKYKNSLISSAVDEEEKAILEIYADCFYLTSEGTDDCTAFAYLPASYVVVDSDNSNYSSKDGYLYNKNQTKLLYIPFTAHTDINGSVSTNDRIEDGLELLQTVNTVSAFSNWAAYNQSNYPLSRSGAMHSRNENITFNAYSYTLDVDYPEFYDRAGAETIEQLFEVSTKEEFVSMMQEQGPMGGAFVSFFPFWSAPSAQEFIFISPKTETETNTRKGIRELFKNFYSRMYPDSTQEEINNQVDMMLESYAPQSNIMDGKINRNGLVSVESPYSLKFLNSDDYIYSVSLNNVPARYKPVDIQSIIPSCEGARQVTFNLELKKGTVNLSVYDLDNEEYYQGKNDFDVYNADDNTLFTTISMTDGAASSVIPYGEYYIVPHKIDGYDFEVERLPLSITEDGQIVNLSFNISIQPSYVLHVPEFLQATKAGEATVNGEVSLTDVVLSKTKSLNIKVAYSGKLRNTYQESNVLSYILYTNDTAITNNSCILNVPYGTSHASIPIRAKITDEVLYAGVYTDTATFTVDVV